MNTQTDFNTTILVVDDEEKTRFCISLALRMKGYMVDTARNGAEALEQIFYRIKTGDPYALLICDIQMPVLSGVECIKQLSRNDVALPVLVISGYDAPVMKKILARYADVRCLEKPLDMEQLYQNVIHLLGTAGQNEYSTTAAGGTPGNTETTQANEQQ